MITEELINETPKKGKKKKAKVKLFKDSNKYKDDVFVAVNGKAIQIQRGKEVEVDEEFAEVLEHSLNQDQETAELISYESNKFKQEAEARGL